MPSREPEHPLEITLPKLDRFPGFVLRAKGGSLIVPLPTRLYIFVYAHILGKP